METPSKQIVRAYITSIDNPDAHVLHATGTEPLEIGQVTVGHEALLHSLGQRVLMNGYLAIDHLRSRKNVADPLRGIVVNVSDVQTKPIDRDKIKLNEGYRWSDQ